MSFSFSSWPGQGMEPGSPPWVGRCGRRRGTSSNGPGERTSKDRLKVRYRQKPMKIYEHLWRSVKVHENPLKPMKIFEDRWKFMKIFKPSMKIYATLSIYENAWKSLKIYETQWKSIKIYKHPWQWKSCVRLFLMKNIGQIGVKLLLESGWIMIYNLPM